MELRALVPDREKKKPGVTSMRPGEFRAESQNLSAGRAKDGREKELNYAQSLPEGPQGDYVMIPNQDHFLVPQQVQMPDSQKESVLSQAQKPFAIKEPGDQPLLTQEIPNGGGTSLSPLATSGLTRDPIFEGVASFPQQMLGHKHLLNIQTDNQKEIHQARGSVVTVEKHDESINQRVDKQDEQPEVETSATQFQNQALRQGFQDLNSGADQDINRQLDARSRDEQNQSRNKRQVYSKESSKTPVPIIQGEGNIGPFPADATEYDQSPIHTLITQQMAKIGIGEDSLNQVRVARLQEAQNFQQAAADSMAQQHSLMGLGIARNQFGKTVGHPAAYDAQFFQPSFEELSQYRQRGLLEELENRREEHEKNLQVITRENPNIVLDQHQILSPAVLGMLAHQKGLIQKDGNIMLEGVLIKGAPSLGTKFNPNFRDPHHAPAGNRPQSRGLTQGNIIQIASKALAAMTSPVVRGPNNHVEPKNLDGNNLQKTRIKQRYNSLESKLGPEEQDSLLMEGTRKQATPIRMGEKRPKRRSKSKKNRDIAQSMKSMSSNQTKQGRVFTEKKIIKIQGGGEHGQDKVQLNVKFTQATQGGRVLSQQQSYFNNSNHTAHQSPLHMQKIQSFKKQTLLANESHYNMSDHSKDKRGQYQFARGIGETNGSADGGDAGQRKQGLEVTGSQSPSPELRAYDSKHGRTLSGRGAAQLQILRQSGVDTENSKGTQDNGARESTAERHGVHQIGPVPKGKIKSGMGTFSDHRPILLTDFEAVKRGDTKQMAARRSQAVESPTHQVIEERQPNTASEAAAAMRLDLQQLQPDDEERSDGQNIGPGANLASNITADEGSQLARKSKQGAFNQKIAEKGPFDRVEANLLQTQTRSNLIASSGLGQKRKAQRGSKQTTSSNRGGTPHHASQVRKGRPGDDFKKQIKYLEQAEALRAGRAQAAQTPVLGGALYYQSSRSPQASGVGQNPSHQRLSPQAFRGTASGAGGFDKLSTDGLQVRPLNEADVRRLEGRAGGRAVAGAPVPADAERANDEAHLAQQHELVSSDQQLNSAISEDKIKTEKIGEQTVSPENTLRQDFHQNFSNLNVNEEINEQSAAAEQMQSLRLGSPPRRLLAGHGNKLSLPVAQTGATTPPEGEPRPGYTGGSGRRGSRQAQSNAQLDNTGSRALNVNIDTLDNTSPTQAGQANSKRVILTHASHNQQTQVQASGQMGLSRPSRSSNSQQSREVIVEVLQETRQGQPPGAAARNEQHRRGNLLEMDKGRQKPQADGETADGDPMDQGDPADADHHDMQMKPKGINIFQTDLMKSENGSQVIREPSFAPSKREGDSAQPPGGSMVISAKVRNTRDIKNNGIDTALINYEDSRGRRGASPNAKQQESPCTSQEGAQPRAAKLPKQVEQSMNIKSGGLNLNLRDVKPHAKDDMSSRIGPDHVGTFNLKDGKTRPPITVGTSRGQSHRGGPLTSKTSKLMSKIISESMLDCRDIGIGTGASNGAESDPFLKNSQPRTSGVDMNGPQRNRDRLGNEYKPIQQVNVHLAHAGFLPEGRSRKSGAASRNKSSIHEKASIYRSELGGESTIPPSESPNAVLTNRKIRTIGSEARESQGSQARASGGVSRDSMTGLMDMQAVLVSQKKQQKQKRDMQLKARLKAHKPRAKKLHEYLGKQRRVIVKSPNPNDAKVIKIGQYVEQEADVLLNGKIHTDFYKLRPGQETLNEKERRALMQTEIRKQREPNTQQAAKSFSLQGRHIDAQKEEVKAEFEQVVARGPRGTDSTFLRQVGAEDGNQKSKVDLQNQLRRLSLDQLQGIHEILSQGGQIVKSGPAEQWAQWTEALAQQARGPGQEAFSLSSLNHEPGVPAPEDQDKLKIIDYLQSQVQQHFDPQQLSESLGQLQGHLSPQMWNNAAPEPGSAHAQEQYKRQNSSKQSYTAQQMGARFQGVPAPAATGDGSSGLTQTGSVSQSQAPRQSPGREADFAGQVMTSQFPNLKQFNQRNQETGVGGEPAWPQSHKHGGSFQGPGPVGETGVGKFRQDTHTALGPDPNYLNSPMAMQLEDDQTDNQTVYLKPNRKRPDGAATVNLSQMSSSGVNQNRQAALPPAGQDPRAGNPVQEVEAVENAGKQGGADTSPQRGAQPQLSNAALQHCQQSFGRIHPGGEVAEGAPAQNFGSAGLQPSSRQHLESNILVQRQGEKTSMTVIGENQGDCGPAGIQSTERAFEEGGLSQEHTTTRQNAAGRSSKVSPRGAADFLSPFAEHEAQAVDTNRLSAGQNEAGDLGFALRELTGAGSRVSKPATQPKQPLSWHDAKGSFYQQHGKKFNEDLNMSNQDIAPRRVEQRRTAGQPGRRTPPRGELELRDRLSTLPYKPGPSPLGQRERDQGRPDVEILKSFTPSSQSPASHMRGAVVYDKVQQPAAQIQVSRKSQPLVEASSITWGDTLYLNQERLKSSQLQPALQGSKQEASLGGASATLKTASQHGTQRVGKKTLIHSDLAQYELYMQLRQMKRIGDEIRRDEIVRKAQALGNPATHDAAAERVARSRQERTFFGKVSQVMRQAFSPQAAPVGPRAASIRYLTVPISAQINLPGKRDAADSSHAGTLHQGAASRSQAYSRVAGKGQLTGALSHGGSGHRSGSGCPEDGVSSLRHEDGTPARSVERKRSGVRGQGPSAESVGLYQQSFDPASRMIQKQRYMKQYEQMHHGRAKHTVKVITPPGLRQPGPGAPGHASESFNLAAQLSGGGLADAPEDTRNSAAKTAAAATLKSTVTGGASTVHGRGSATPHLAGGAPSALNPSVTNAELQRAKKLGQSGHKSSQNVGGDLTGPKPGTARNPKNLQIDAAKANQDLNLFLENATVPAEAGAPTPYQQHDYSPMDSGLPLRPKQLGRGQTAPDGGADSFGGGGAETQPGNFDGIGPPSQDGAGLGGNEGAEEALEDQKAAARVSLQAANHRSGVKVIINKHNSQTAHQRNHQSLWATRQRLDIGPAIHTLGPGTRGSAGHFDLAAGVLSDGSFTAASPMASQAQRRAVRLKAGLSKGHKQATGDSEAPTQGAYRYAKGATDHESENQGSRLAENRARRVKPQGVSLGAAHFSAGREGIGSLTSEDALQTDPRSPPAFVQNSLSLNLGTYATQGAATLAKAKDPRRGYVHANAKRPVQQKPVPRGSSQPGFSSTSKGATLTSSGAQNKNMLYSVKNHQLYHSHKMQHRQQGKDRGQQQARSYAAQGRGGDQPLRLSAKAGQSLQGAGQRGGSIFVDPAVQQIVQNNFNQHQLFAGSGSSYQNARRIMTADNAGLGSLGSAAVGRKRRARGPQTLHGTTAFSSEVISADFSRTQDFKYVENYR